MAMIRDLLKGMTERRDALSELTSAMELHAEWRLRQDEQDAVVREQQVAQRNAREEEQLVAALDLGSARAGSEEEPGPSCRCLTPWAALPDRESAAALPDPWRAARAALAPLLPAGLLDQATPRPDQWLLQSWASGARTDERAEALVEGSLDVLTRPSSTTGEQAWAYRCLCQLAGGRPDPELCLVLGRGLGRAAQELRCDRRHLAACLRQRAADVGYAEQAAAGMAGEQQDLRLGPGQLACVKMVLSLATMLVRTALREPAAAGAPDQDGEEHRLFWATLALQLSRDPEAPRLLRHLHKLFASLLASWDERGWAAAREQLVGRLKALPPAQSLALLRGLLRPALADAQAADRNRLEERRRQLRVRVAALAMGRVAPPFRWPSGAASSLAESISSAAEALTQQTWFGAPEDLVGRAVSGDGPLLDAQAYGMAALERLLMLADAALWPDAMNGHVSAPTLRRWLRFLVAVQRGIRCMVPEDQAVKVLATHFELEYRQLAAGRGLCLEDT
ncbi:hypothetical protein QBZ16_004463 [Prototheca wickerhamii]|uniref:Uncharacterized protein n=1 Tax=Prototheca wickerhamii TaxID=3111 RepID=A0AAD9IG38_PROWI|nr:hypothetical protein QBZ16_004463 [Prototheca wickerhamii]